MIQNHCNNYGYFCQKKLINNSGFEKKWVALSILTMPQNDKLPSSLISVTIIFPKIVKAVTIIFLKILMLNFSKTSHTFKSQFSKHLSYVKTSLTAG